MPFYTTEVECVGNFTEEEFKELNQKIALEHNGFVTYIALDRYEYAAISKDIFDFSPDSEDVQRIESFVTMCKSFIANRDNLKKEGKKSFLRFDTGIRNYQAKGGNFSLFFLMYVERFIRQMFNDIDTDITLHGDFSYGSYALNLEIYWSC